MTRGCQSRRDGSIALCGGVKKGHQPLQRDFAELFDELLLQDAS